MVKSTLQASVFKPVFAPTSGWLGKISFLFLFAVIFCNRTLAQVGISNTTITPDASSILELRSSSAGFLAPRMTTVQRNAIASPVAGLLIYNTDTNQFNYYTGSIWQVVSGGTGVSSLNGNTGALTMDTGYISNFSTKARSLFSATAPITYANGTIGISQSTSSTNGFLSSTDWNTFNNKQSQINGTGYVQASGTAVSYVPTIPISGGGTNSSTALNNNRIMVSSGGKIVESGGLTNGQLLIGSTGAAPAAANLSAGTGITITNSAGSISITNSKPSYKTRVIPVGPDILLSATSMTDITGLSFPVSANTTYNFHAIIAYNSTDANSGIDVGVNGPASPSFMALQGQSSRNNSDLFRYSENGYDQPSSQVSKNSLSGDNIAILEGIITTGAAGGTVIIRVDANKSNNITINTSRCSLEYW